MKLNHYITKILIATGALLSSCINQLDQYPHIEKTPVDVYTSVENYEMVLAKLYGSFVLAGQDKGGGNEDILGSRGFDYMRCYFNMQEVGTDEVAMIWHASDGQTALSYLSWDSTDPWVFDMYYRIYYTIALCNEFLRYANVGAIGGFSESDQQQIMQMSYEARFLRALAYSHALDMFRNVPFVDENDPIGTYIPPRYTAQQIFEYIVNELKDIENELPNRLNTVYPRVGRGAAYTLLAKVYLNAETYGCDKHYTECITYCKKVIDEGYSLEPEYTKLFNADNHLRTNEIILGFSVDSRNAVSWGASTYIVCGQCSGSFGLDLGVKSSWEMFRARSPIANLYDEKDGRNLFYKTDRPQEVTSLDDPNVGYFYMKWSNLTDGGSMSNEVDGVDTDLPLFRLADVYLMLAESFLREGQGTDRTSAVYYVNLLRARAFGSDAGNIDPAALTLDFVLNERARELSLEMVRRTDLIRYDYFTTDKYIWEWKGGTMDGRAVDGKYNIYPIPYAELTANPNLYNENY